MQSLKNVLISLLTITQATDPQDTEMIEALKKCSYLFRDIYQKRVKGGKQEPRAKLEVVKG